MSSLAFEEFPKIPRLRRDCVITEKLDGTNAQVFIRPVVEHGLEFGYDIQVEIEGLPHYMRAGSRNRWLELGKDNFGFAAWVHENAHELAKLGPGHHFGEWYGQGIQRRYGLDHKRFALFNTARWNPQNPNKPACCEVVPVLFTGPLGDATTVADVLREHGSYAVPGWTKPEGIVIYHSASRQLFKQLLENDDVPKSTIH